MSVSVVIHRRREHISADWLATVLWREIDRRGPRPHQHAYTRAGWERSGLAILLDELEAAGLNRVAVYRRLYEVLYHRQSLVKFALADEILQALELPHLWHLEE